MVTQVSRCLGRDEYEVTFFWNSKFDKRRVRESEMYDFISNRRKFEREDDSEEFVEAVKKAVGTILEQGAYSGERVRNSQSYSEYDITKKKRKYTHRQEREEKSKSKSKDPSRSASRSRPKQPKKSPPKKPPVPEEAKISEAHSDHGPMELEPDPEADPRLEPKAEEPGSVWLKQMCRP